MFVKIKEFPQSIQLALKGLNYNRADIKVEAATEVSPFIGGGKGMRGFYLILNLETGEKKLMQGSWGGSNMFNPDNQVDNDHGKYKIPPGVIVIQGTQGYRGTMASLYIHPDNVVKFLPEKKAELDPRDRWILYTFDGLTSAGRRKEWERNNDWPGEDDLNRLASEGFLKRSKNGATRITTEGKNVLERRPGSSIRHPSREY